MENAIILAGRTAHDNPWPSVTMGPKQLVPLANRPILFHNLDALREAGVRRATILVEHPTGAAIKAAVADGSRWELSVSYAERAPGAGMGDALAVARELPGEDPVLVEHADAVLRERMAPHISAFAGEELDTLALRLPGRGPLPSTKQLDGGYLLTRRALDVLCERRELAADLVARVREGGGRVAVREVDGCLPCHGDQDTLLDGNRRVLEGLVADVDGAYLDGCELQGPVVVHRAARLKRTLVRGPAIIGPRAVLTDAYVGPYTSIGAGVVIEGAEVEHSIVLPGAEIRFVGARVESSVIGRGARLIRSFGLPNAMRLSVGDGAEVRL